MSFLSLCFGGDGEHEFEEVLEFAAGGLFFPDQNPCKEGLVVDAAQCIGSAAVRLVATGCQFDGGLQVAFQFIESDGQVLQALDDGCELSGYCLLLFLVEIGG
ncbi:hypothetical protein ITJ43_14390 [Microbacterium sp. VKM Ac-2870]|uniref:hypothetical protein n=1 Tax=Microbacterium sp. VKM Ac-2870 TaxID=2783825 RepID=UPI00188B4014|nr:hypothetical protein [Microbacterium sp. VKM Ac-2870]MBF4563318.1 hypothetical protein [Microbacterium sp. VKM Ac-2870]